MTGYADPQATHNPATGGIPPASWGDMLRDDIVWLAGDSASGNPKPMCRVYNSAAISTATATFTALTFDSERYDVGGCHSTSSNTGRLTVPTGGGGVYSIFGNIKFASNATGLRVARIRLNGTTYIAADENAPDATTLCVKTEYKLAAADYVELVAYQASGGLLNVSLDANFSPEFGMSWIGLG